jgi:hypothetical protein
MSKLGTSAIKGNIARLLETTSILCVILREYFHLSNRHKPSSIKSLYAHKIHFIHKITATYTRVGQNKGNIIDTVHIS